MTLVLKSAIHFEKCGEIFTGFDADERLFELKCVFCSAAFESLPLFVDHINNRHLDPLLKEDQLGWTSANNFYDCSALEGGTDDVKMKNIALEHDEKLSHENDPLNESIDEIESTKEDLISETFDGSSVHDSLDNRTDEDFGTKSSVSDSSNTEVDNDREITLALIDHYKKLPVLWDAKHSYFKRPPQRKLALKKLANSLTLQFGKHLQDTDVERRLRKLRKRYTSDLISQRVSNSKNETFIPCWYFEKLDFLKNKIDLSQNDGADLQNKDKSFQGNLSDEQQIQMIEIYESFPCLWNIQDITYRSRNKRKAAMEAMLKCIEEKMQLKLTEVRLNKRLYRIRCMCTKEKIQKMKCKRLGTDYKPKCKFYFKTKFLHDHVHPFKCPSSDCMKIFKSYDQYQTHVSSHTGGLPFSCSICQKGLSNIGALNTHIRRHKQDFKFICKDCGKGFVSALDLLRHSRIHSGERPYCCEICGKSFAQESGFRRHKKWHEKQYSYSCDLCQKGFYDKNSLTEHMNIHLNIRDKICNVCGKGFTTNAYLRKHKETHEEKKYICKICSKSFAQYAGLFTHMKMH